MLGNLSARMFLACSLVDAACAIANIVTALIFINVSWLHAFSLVFVIRSFLHVLMAVAVNHCFQHVHSLLSHQCV